MKLSHPFPSEVRFLFLYVYACFLCGRSDKGLELHHIYGRVSSSALNASPLCKDCHAGMVHNQEEHRTLLPITMRFLMAQKYRLTQTDHDFLDMVKNDLAGLDGML